DSGPEARMTLPAGTLDPESLRPCAVGERLDTSVVQVTAAVEDRGLDPQLARREGDQPADLVRLRLLVALERLRQRGPADAGERPAGLVVDELPEDAAVRAEDDQARPRGRAHDPAAHAPVAAQARLACGEGAHARFPTFLRTNSPW